MPYINFYRIISVFVSIFSYILLLTGLWFIFSNKILWLFKSKYYYGRFRKKHIQKKENKLVKHINMLLSIIFNTNNPLFTQIFFIITIGLFVFNFLILSKHSSVLFTLIFSIIISLLPYGYLQLRLRTIRVESSYEGERLITELINQYKINYFNMFEAIDKAIYYLKDSPHSQKLLFRLSLALKEYRTEEELQDILKEFTYAVDTEWIKMLSNNIYLAVEDGVNVVVSLEDILHELKNLKIDMEYNKRLNSEGFAIIKYLVPIFYFLSIYIAVKYFNFTLFKFIDYQINTNIGFKFFIVILILMLINYSIMIIFRKQKFDF